MSVLLSAQCAGHLTEALFHFIETWTRCLQRELVEWPAIYP
jgi:hypothetical protein